MVPMESGKLMLPLFYAVNSLALYLIMPQKPQRTRLAILRTYGKLMVPFWTYGKLMVLTTQF
jgi:hypothetical protein